jgi:hypothetical protein
MQHRLRALYLHTALAVGMKHQNLSVRWHNTDVLVYGVWHVLLVRQCLRLPADVYT